jgi:hypothetical protein
MNETDRDRVTAHKGFFPVVVGQEVHIQDAGGVIFIAKQDLTLSGGGGQWLVAGRDQIIERGGGAILVSGQAHVTNGFVGLLVASRVTLEGSAHALLTLSAPVAAAAAAGLVVGLWLGRRRGVRV